MTAELLEKIKKLAKIAAESLREKAQEMEETDIIDAEEIIPEWKHTADYSTAPVGAPVKYGEQVYALLQPHNAEHYPNTSPEKLPALWRILHTKDPAKAKPWARPTGTADMYRKGECMIWEDGKVYIACCDTVYSPAEYPGGWEMAK